MSWLDQYGLNVVPAEVASEPEWAASVLGSASAAELAQAQAELDMWSTMAFNGDDPFGSNQAGPPKETGLAAFANLPWGDHDGPFAAKSSDNHYHHHQHGSPLGLFSQLSAPPVVSSFHEPTTISPPETHSASDTPSDSVGQTISPPASRPKTGRKRSLSQSNGTHNPQSPLPSDSGSGTISNSGSNDDKDGERTGPLTEADKRRRNTEASARFRAKKRQREAQLRQDTSVLADRVANLEKIADSVRPRFLIDFPAFVGRALAGFSLCLPA